MSHWSDTKIRELEEVVFETGWSLFYPEKENEPVVFEHDDKTDLVISKKKGEYYVLYKEQELGNNNIEAAVDEEKRVTSWENLDGAVEWTREIIEKHEDLN